MTGSQDKRASATDTASTRLGRFVSSTWISGLLALSVLVNILLARDVSSLKGIIETLEAEGALQIGTAVPVIQGRPVQGAKDSLNYSDVSIPTVLYVFTPQCLWCIRNLENLHTLIENSNVRYRVIGISLNSEGLREYLAKEHLLLPVYTDIAVSTKAGYHLGATPTTIVVSPTGRVLRVWYGAYQDGVRQEIEDYLHIHLPGCCDTGERRADNRD